LLYFIGLKLTDIDLTSDERNKDKGMHGNFDYLWTGLFRINDHCRRNAYFIEGLDGECFGSGPVNGMFLKHYQMK
jgi:hypothetical protein